MPVETDLSRVQYDTNGTTGPWSVPFYFLADEDLSVTYADADGVETALVLDTDFSVTGAGDEAGGTVSTTTAYAAGGTLTILRDLDALQPAEFQDGDAFPAATVNRGFDRLTMLVQQLVEKVNRAFTLTASEADSAALPAPSARLGTLLGFDSVTGAWALVAGATGTALDLAVQYASSLGASLIGFIGAGTGAILRTLQDLLRERVSADSYETLQDALNTGKDVFVPGTGEWRDITAALQFVVSDQRIYGERGRSKIRQLTSLANVIEGTSLSGLVVEGLHLYCVGDSSNQNDGQAVYLNGCSDCSVRHNIVENHRGWGVTLRDTSDSEVTRNTFINANIAGVVDDTESAGDIQIVRNSSNNEATHNRCRSGGGVAVKVQTVSDGEAANFNLVAYNNIKGYSIYGIAVYRNSQALPILQQVRHTSVIGNIVDSISGELPNSIAGTYTYGAGIYSQGAEDIIIAVNQVSNTHTAAVAFSSTLAPGAIGVTNQSRFTLDNNSIRNAGVNGVDVSDANGFGEALLGAHITNNRMTSVAARMIRVRTLSGVSILGNTGDTAGTAGLEVNQGLTTLVVDYNVADNKFKNVTGTAFVFKYIDGLKLANNLASMCSAGIGIGNCNSVSATGNQVKDQTGRGFQVESTCTIVSLADSLIDGDGTSTEGIRLDAATRQSNNKVSGCVAPWAGNFAPWATLTVNSTTPSVADGREFITNNTNPTTITNFTGGHDGQELRVVFTDANTTLDFSSSNLVGNNGVDRAMAAGDAITATYRASTSKWYCVVVDA